MIGGVNNSSFMQGDTMNGKDGLAQGKMLNINGPANSGIIELQGNQNAANQSIITQVRGNQDEMNRTPDPKKEKKKKKKDR